MNGLGEVGCSAGSSSEQTGRKLSSIHLQHAFHFYSKVPIDKAGCLCRMGDVLPYALDRQRTIVDGAQSLLKL